MSELELRAVEEFVISHQRWGWRVFCAWITRGAVVLLIDNDGEINMRLRRTDRYRRAWAKRMPFGVRNVYLKDSGAVGNGAYCEHWIMYADYRAKETA